MFEPDLNCFMGAEPPASYYENAPQQLIMGQAQAPGTTHVDNNNNPNARMLSGVNNNANCFANAPVPNSVARGSRNTEKRRERSKVAARCRRGKESEIFNELSACLPVSEQSRANLDKASVMRLTLCDLRLKQMMENIEGIQSVAKGLSEEFDGLINNSISGFVVVCSADGDVIYVSEGIQNCLGLSQYEVMGQSLLEYSHPCDHTDVKEMLHAGSVLLAPACSISKSALFRMKSANSARGRNVHHRTTNYKVVHCLGRMFSTSAAAASTTDAAASAASFQDKTWFVGICEPLLCPSDVDIPLNKQSFVTKHAPDMKFEVVDDSITQFMGYSPEQLVGQSLFDFYHACDTDTVARSFKNLYAKGQTITERTRFLAKGGGWLWLVTQATTLNNAAGKPLSVVCIHFVTSGVENASEIVSHVQLPSTDVPSSVPMCKLEPTPQKTVLPLSETTNISSVAAAPEAPVIIPATGGATSPAPLILSKPTPSTAKIFAPRTEDMDTGFLMPVNDTLIVTKEEPEDLTHLAPVAGDDCVPISNVPLLDDLLQWLDEADMEYSVLDGYEEPLPIPLISAASACTAGPLGLPPTVVVNHATVIPSGGLNPADLLLQNSKDAMPLLIPGGALSPETSACSALLHSSEDPTLLSACSSESLLLSPFKSSPGPPSPPDFMSSDIFSAFYTDNPPPALGGPGNSTAGASSHKSKAGGGYDDIPSSGGKVTSDPFSGFPLVSDFQENIFSPMNCFGDAGEILAPGSPPHINIIEGGGCATGGNSAPAPPPINFGGKLPTMLEPNGGGGAAPPPNLYGGGLGANSTTQGTATQVGGNHMKFMACGGGGAGGDQQRQQRPLPAKMAKQLYEDPQGRGKPWAHVASTTPTNPPWAVGQADKMAVVGSGMDKHQDKQQLMSATIGTQTGGDLEEMEVDLELGLVADQVEEAEKIRRELVQQRQRQIRRYKQLLMNPVVLQALVLSGRLNPAVRAQHQNSRKRNFVGKLLAASAPSGGSSAAASALPQVASTGLAQTTTANLPGAGFLELPSALVELTNVDCEVNAPMMNSEPLLDGADLLTALDA